MSTSVRFTDENAPSNTNKPKPLGKPANTLAASKPPLGDITNLSQSNNNLSHAHNNLKQPLNKLRRTTSTKPVSNPRRQTGRLIKRAAAAAAAAAAVCNLVYPDTNKPDLHQLDHFKLPQAVLDIDAKDRTNHLAVSEFASEIHANFINREHAFMPDPNYMARQLDITLKMRAILIDWLVDVHQKFKLQPETLHLTVNIIDRFLDKTSVQRRKLQLVGVTAMLIASKYQEIYAPEVADFVYISDKAYTKEQILSMEAHILNLLNFEVTVPSSLVFMHRCLKASHTDTAINLDLHKALTHYIVELALQDPAMLSFRPSIRAAAACKLAASLCHFHLNWDKSMVFHSGGWTTDQLAQCEHLMATMLTHETDVNGTNKLTALKRKFSTAKYSSVSTTIADFSQSSHQVAAMEISH